MKRSKWITVFQSTDEYIVGIYKMKLETHDIPVHIFNQRDSSYNTFGYIYLNVLAKHEKIAIELIEEANE